MGEWKQLELFGKGRRKRRTPRPLLADERAEMVRLYQAGWGTERIGQHLDRHSGVCYNALVDAGVEMRDRRRYSLNEDYFAKIDTPAKARWLGFLAADGHVGINKDWGHRYFAINIGAKDLQHLQRFAAAIEYAGPLRPVTKYLKTTGKTYHQYNIQIQSNRFCDHLISHGIVPNKSDLLQPWTENPDLVRFWLGGLFDGDGSLTQTAGKRSTPRSASLIGTESVIRFYTDAINRLTGSKVSPFKDKRCRVAWRVIHGGIRICRPIATYLYTDLCGSVPLERKQLRAEEIVAQPDGQLDWSSWSNEDLLALYRREGTMRKAALVLGIKYKNAKALFRRRGIISLKSKRHLTAEVLLTLRESLDSWYAVARHIGMRYPGLCRLRKRRGLPVGN